MGFKVIKKVKVTRLVMAVIVVIFCISAVTLLQPAKAETNLRVDNTATFSDDVAKHLSEVRNISIEEARERAEWQNKAGSLNDTLINRLPKEDFGGMWIDKNTDRVKIGVLNQSAKDETASRRVVAEQIANFDLSEAIDFVKVKYTYAELKDVKEYISKISQDRAGNTDWPIQVGITPNTNEVLVHIPQDSSKLTAGHRSVLGEVESEYGDMVKLKTYDEIPKEEACNWWFCDSPLRGGVGIKGSCTKISSPPYYDCSTPPQYNDGIDCTAGFNVVGNSGTRYVVTAGHCAPAGSGWASEKYNYTTEKIGPIHGTLYGQNGRDAMIIKIREDTYDWDVIGKILVRGGDHAMNGYSPPSYNEAYDITDSGASGGLVGERICVSGAIMGGHPSEPNGGSCGAVHEVDISWTAGGVTTVDVIRAGYCSRGGDSGMPVFRLGKALGVHRGTGTSDICGNYKYYTGMNPIIRGFNNNISIF